LSLPFIIHTREADDDTFAVLSAEGRGVGGVFHCFTGGVDRARKALDLGFHLSLAGIVTFPKATDLHEVAGFVPTIGCSSKPTARFSLRCRIAARETSRRSSRTSSTQVAERRRHTAVAAGCADDPEFPRTVCTDGGYTALTLRAQLC
jgi:hypothetical protein